MLLGVKNPVGHWDMQSPSCKIGLLAGQDVQFLREPWHVTQGFVHKEHSLVTELYRYPSIH